VPLARLKVDRTNGCRVVSICNWTDRTFVITFPMIWEWISIFPIFQQVRKAFEKACCGALVAKQFEAIKIGNFAAGVKKSAVKPTPAPAAAKVASAGKPAFVTLAESAFAERTKAAGVHTLLLGALGAYDEKGVPFAQPIEIENAAAFLMLNEIVRPSLGPMLPDSWLRAAAARPAASSDEVTALRETVAQLKKTVAKHGADLTKLKRGPNK